MWIVTLIAAAAIGQEARCPDSLLAVRSAEQDVVSYFLRDAELGLTEAIAGMGCGAQASREQLAPFWLAQGVIWSFMDDERADYAYAAARAADPDYFMSDYGDAVRARWERSTAPAGGTGELLLRGLEGTDWVAIDGTEATEPYKVSPGFHLLQVGTAEQARFARLLDMEPESEVTVVVPTDGGSAPTMQLAGVVAFADVAPPIRRKGRSYLDANDEKVSWRLEVQPIAAADPTGRTSLQLYRSNLAAGVGVSAVGVGALYSTYMFAWDATAGHNLDSGAAWTLTATSAAATGGAAVLVARILKKRRAHRTDIETAANRTLGGSR